MKLCSSGTSYLPSGLEQLTTTVNQQVNTKNHLSNSRALQWNRDVTRFFSEATTSFERQRHIRVHRHFYQVCDHTVGAIGFYMTYLIQEKPHRLIKNPVVSLTTFDEPVWATHILSTSISRR